MIRLLGLAAISLLVALSPAQAARWPVWAAAAADDSYLERFAEEDAVVALDAWSITVSAGERSGTRLWVVQVLNEDGRGEAILTLPSNAFGGYDRIRMWVRDPGGRTVRFSSEDGSLISLSERKVLDDTDVLILAPPGVRAGTKVAVQATFSRRAERPQDLFQVQGSIPVVRYTVEIETPDAWNVQPRVFQSEQHGFRERGLRWEFFDVPGRGAPRGSYAPQPPRTVLALNYSAPGTPAPFGTWAEVNAWAMSLFELPAEPHASVGALAGELPAEPAAATKTAGLRSRELRYFGVELGWGGFKPRPPETTLQRAFGDCKDKTQLMVSLLGAVEVPAYPTLIIAPSSGHVPDDVPSPFVFNHAVVAIPWDGPTDEGMMVVASPELGRLRVYDPTLSDRSPQDVAPHLEGATALVLHPHTTGLLRLPGSTPEQNVYEGLHEWNFDSRGILSGKTVFRRQGAMRTSLEGEGGDWIESQDLRNRTRQSFSDVLPDVDGLAITPISVDDDGAWTYEAIYRAGGVLGESGAIRSLGLGVLLPATSIPLPSSEEPGAVDYLPFLGVFRESFDVTIPGYRLIGGMRSLERSVPTGHARVEVEPRPNGLRITRELKLNDRELSAKDRDAILQLRSALRQINSHTLLFEATVAETPVASATDGQ